MYHENQFKKGNNMDKIKYQEIQHYKLFIDNPQMMVDKLLNEEL